MRLIWNVFFMYWKGFIKNIVLLQWKLFKNDEKCLFHVKIPFRSWDIYIFALTVWLCRNLLDKKPKVNFKIYDVANWTTNTLLLNISRSKGNKTMNLGRLIENKMINIFLKNNTQNMMEKLVLDPFMKNQNREYLRINSLKCYEVCFIVCPSRGLSKYIKPKVLITCFCLIKSFFIKQKEIWN